MSIGITRQIANNSHQQVTIPSGNYPWPTIRVLNPNDGVVYVKQNADITNTGYGSWDYKVPSQSFGLLPGEGQGWQSVGLYYLDQSGTGGNGEISIYLSQQDASEPIFVSIGRAIVSQTTSMDIVQGSQPNAPGAGLTRIWSDAATGSLNILGSNGTNKVVLDSTNFSTYVQPLINSTALAGDLYGTVSNGHVGLQVASYIYGLDTHGTNARLLGHAGTDSTYLFTGTNGYLYFYSDYPGNQLGQWQSQSGTSLLTVNGGLNVTGALNVNGRVNAVDANHSGDWLYLASYPGIAWDGTTTHIYNGLMLDNGYLQVNGAANSPGALIALTQRVGPQICLYDAGGGNFFGFGINNSELSIISSGLWGFRVDSNGGPLVAQISAGGVLHAGSNTAFMGQYMAGTAFSSTVYNAWVATPITVSFTVPTGHSGSVQVTYGVMLTSAVINTLMYISPAIDAAVTWYQAEWIATANNYQLYSGTMVFTGLAAGAHTATIYVDSNSGVWSIWNGANNSLTVVGLVS